MGFFVSRGILLLLVCIGYLALQPQKVSSLTSLDLALRWKQGLLPLVQNSRMLRSVAIKDLQALASSAPVPSMVFDPNQSNKRTVRKGSDPIHNRCWQFESVRQSGRGTGVFPAKEVMAWGYNWCKTETRGVGSPLPPQLFLNLCLLDFNIFICLAKGFLSFVSSIFFS